MPSEMTTHAWLESDDGQSDLVWPGGESSFHAGVRAALSPEYQELSPEEIDDLVDRVMESASAEDAESFGSFLSDLGRTVAPIAAQVLPVAAPVVGTLVGGPAGAAVGRMVGQYAGQALGGATPPPPRAAPPRVYPAPRFVAQPTPRPIPQAVMQPPSPVPQLVSQPAPPSQPQAAPPQAGTPPTTTPPVAPPDAAATSALAQLIALLESPALRQLLAGQVLGQAGVKTVPVGPENIPVSFPAMMEALSVLSRTAAETAPPSGESSEAESTAYLRDASGQFAYDPAVPEERAAALVAHVRAGEAEWGQFDESVAEAHDGSVGGWLTRAGLIQ